MHCLHPTDVPLLHKATLLNPSILTSVYPVPALGLLPLPKIISQKINLACEIALNLAKSELIYWCFRSSLAIQLVHCWSKYALIICYNLRCVCRTTRLLTCHGRMACHWCHCGTRLSHAYGVSHAIVSLWHSTTPHLYDLTQGHSTARCVWRDTGVTVVLNCHMRMSCHKGHCGTQLAHAYDVTQVSLWHSTATCIWHATGVTVALNCHLRMACPGDKCGTQLPHAYGMLRGSVWHSTATYVWHAAGMSVELQWRMPVQRLISGTWTAERIPKVSQRLRLTSLIMATSTDQG